MTVQFVKTCRALLEYAAILGGSFCRNDAAPGHARSDVSSEPLGGTQPSLRGESSPGRKGGHARAAKLRAARGVPEPFGASRRSAERPCASMAVRRRTIWPWLLGRPRFILD